MTLEIRVAESVNVLDGVKRVIRRIFEKLKTWFHADEIEDEPTQEDDSERGPPDLSVEVGEDINAGDKLA